MFFHAYDQAMMANIVFPDGWARSWIVLKIGRLQTSGTRIRGLPREVSHGESTPGKRTVSSQSEEVGSLSMGH